MTKGGPFDAALSLLEGAAFAIRGHAKNREKALRNCREISNACLVLRAAGKCEVMLSSDGSGKRVIHVSDLMALEEALLAALPANTEDSDD